MQLPDPTAELVAVSVKKFDDENRVLENALQLLVERFPRNDNPSGVLLKVVSINALYRTAILAFENVARHILECKVDEDIQAGEALVVDRIARISLNGKTRYNYSFATKYCSWHKPDLYPIFDSRVEECLWAYQRWDSFHSFRRDDLWTYSNFREIVSAFRERYHLNSFTFKQLDKFLYLLGGEIIENKQSKSVDTKESPKT